MGIFSGLASILGGSDTVAKTVQDSAQSLFKIADDSFYTDQEKAENKLKLMPFYVDLYKSVASENTGTALARRWFFMIITANNVLFAYLYLLAKLTAHDDIARAVLDASDQFKLGWAFVISASFYFMTHVFQAMSSYKN